MVGLTFSWGLNGVAAKISYAGYEPGLPVDRALGHRRRSACFGWCRWRGIDAVRRATARSGPASWPACCSASSSCCLFVGLDYTTVARSTLLVNTMPFWVLIGGHFLLGEHIIAAQVRRPCCWPSAAWSLVFSDKLCRRPGPTLIGRSDAASAAGIFWAATMHRHQALETGRASAEKLLLYQLAGAAVVGAACCCRSPARRSARSRACRHWRCCSSRSTSSPSPMCCGSGCCAAIRRPGLSSFTFLTPVFGVLCGGFILGEPLSVRIFVALGADCRRPDHRQPAGAQAATRSRGMHARHSQRPRSRQAIFPIRIRCAARRSR